MKIADDQILSQGNQKRDCHITRFLLEDLLSRLLCFHLYGGSCTCYHALPHHLSSKLLQTSLQQPGHSRVYITAINFEAVSFIQIIPCLLYILHQLVNHMISVKGFLECFYLLKQCSMVLFFFTCYKSLKWSWSIWGHKYDENIWFSLISRFNIVNHFFNWEMQKWTVIERM